MSHSQSVILRALCVGHGSRVAAGPLDHRLPIPGLVALTGRNGSGKSTLLRTLAGLLPPVAGLIHWPDGRRPIIASVPQQERLDPVFPFRVKDVMDLGMPRVFSAGERRRRAAAALGCCNVEALNRRLFSTLSGGEKQRVLLARALACEAPVLLLDEPTSGIDAETERQILALLATLKERRKLLIVMATHRPELLAGAVDLQIDLAEAA